MQPGALQEPIAPQEGKTLIMTPEDLSPPPSLGPLALLQAPGPEPGWGHLSLPWQDNLMGIANSYSGPCLAPPWPVTQTGNLEWQVPIRSPDQANRMCLCSGDNESEGG